MAEYIPSPSAWVREQVELYERTNGAQGNTLRETGLAVIIVTNTGNRSGAVRKTPLMRVCDGKRYVLVGSKGGAPDHPVWVYNLRADGSLDHEAIGDLARALLASGSEGLVLTGTTGETPTLSIEEQVEVWRTVRKARHPSAGALAHHLQRLRR